MTLSILILKHNVTQHNDTIMTLGRMAFSIITLTLIDVILSVAHEHTMLSVHILNIVMLNVVLPSIMAPSWDHYYKTFIQL